MAKRKTRSSTKAQTLSSYNRVLKYADYEVLNINKRKQWEIELSLLTLRENGILHEDAEVLGVGAAKEATIYHLSNEVKRVFATDLYVTPGQWHSHIPKDFLIDPARHKPQGVTCNSRRIVAQHADMRNLPYEDNSFDAIFSASSIEHVGGYEDIAQAAKEIGRVLKPGGIASLSTEWKLRGDGYRHEHIVFFDSDSLQRHIIDPSGLEPIDELDIEFDCELSAAVSQPDLVKGKVDPPFVTHLHLAQFIFTSVHLALQKPA